MHWCMDETLALLSVLPFIGYLFGKLHVWYHAKFHHKCHEKNCDAEHVDHVPTDTPLGGHGPSSISTKDVKTLPFLTEVDDEVSFTLTLRGRIVSTVIFNDPMTHEQVVAKLPNDNADEVHSTINQLVEEGALVLDGDLLKEGNIFSD